MRWLVGWTTLLLLATVAVAEPAPRTIANFRLKDAAGRPWALDDVKDRKAMVVVFLGTQCPINNAYLPTLAELSRSYADKGVQFVGVNANEHDTPQTIAEHAKKFGLPFPVLVDDKHHVADRFGAERTPEVFVLDEKRTVRYRGRIDDQFGLGFQRPQPTRRDLVEALDAVLAGKAVSRPETPVAGCLIARAPRPKVQASVTYTKDVARIVQERCQECHRPGQIGPMPLTSYDAAAAWARMIREVVAERRMPPWHADPKHGKFRNDRSLTPKERDTLLAWVDQGCPKGDDKDLPARATYPEGWNIGKPDAVFAMPQAYTVPAKAPKGGVPYRYFHVRTNFDEDKWVQAVEAKPGNKAVVHHIIVYVFPEGKRVKDVADGFGAGMLVAYAPGDLGSRFAPGTAKKIPKGAALVFQMHYTPNGVEQADQSSVGLVFAKEPPTHEVKTRAVANQILFIPPGAESHQVKSVSTFKQDVMLFSLFPHMHLRGKDFVFHAVFPDGKRETLLSVPRYDFGWQANYLLERPLRLPAGTKIECTAHFDNSDKNPNNPDPTKWVNWGDQTWQEMMVGFLDYAVVESSR